MPPSARAHRPVTVRMLVVSVVAGLLLAVLSVPAAAVVVTHTFKLGPLRTTSWRFASAGGDGRTHLVYVTRHRYAYGTATFWESGSEPESAAPKLRQQLSRPGIRVVDDRHRPSDLDTDLDGELRLSASYRVGWPFHSAKSLRRFALSDGNMREIGKWTVKVRGEAYTVPLLPHWPGLLANTAFYTLLVLTPIVLQRWWRLRRRRASGQCPACGYDMAGGAGVCPECGLAARASS